MERIATGVYCLTPAAGIDPATMPAIAAVEWSNTDGPEGDASAMWRRLGGCAPGKYTIVTERHSAEIFGVGPSVEADNVAFVVIVV